jgi:hypothetical protein
VLLRNTLDKECGSAVADSSNFITDRKLSVDRGQETYNADVAVELGGSSCSGFFAFHVNGFDCGDFGTGAPG